MCVLVCGCVCTSVCERVVCVCVCVFVCVCVCVCLIPLMHMHMHTHTLTIQLGFGDLTPDWHNPTICIMEVVVITVGVFVVGAFNSISITLFCGWSQSVSLFGWLKGASRGGNKRANEGDGSMSDNESVLRSKASRSYSSVNPTPEALASQKQKKVVV